MPRIFAVILLGQTLLFPNAEPAPAFSGGTIGDLDAEDVVADTVTAPTVNGSTSVITSLLASTLHVIRFCGNGISGATPAYMGPVLESDIINATAGEQDPVDTTFGSAFCDGLESTTEATADRVWKTSFSFVPTGMVCTGRCTGASAANDAIIYQLRDDTADVSNVACTAGVFTGDDTVKQCVVQYTGASTVAAGSAIAVRMTGTDDDCNDAGDDFECWVFIDP